MAARGDEEVAGDGVVEAMGAAALREPAKGKTQAACSLWGRVNLIEKDEKLGRGRMRGRGR